MSAPEWTLPKVTPLGWEPLAWVPEPEEYTHDPEGLARDAAAHHAMMVHELRQSVLGFVSGVLDLMPYVGTLKGFIEIFTDEDLLTGEDVEWWKHLLTVASPASDAVGAVDDGIAALEAAGDLGNVAPRPGGEPGAGVP